jgi:hypothetical protein
MLKDGWKLLCLMDPHIQTNPDGKGGWKPATSKALETALRFGEWWKPDEVIIGHDFMEFAPISFWNRNMKLDMEKRRLIHDFTYANQILDRITAFAGHKVMFQEGNHDDWMNDYVQMHPELDELINERVVLKFKERGIEHQRMGQVYRVGKAAFTHAWLRRRGNQAKYHAYKMAEDYGSSIFYGHWHAHQVYTRITFDSKPNTAVAIGCLCDLNPGWTRNCPNNWVHQFLFLEFDSKGHFTWYAPILINAKFMFGGLTFSPDGPGPTTMPEDPEGA